MDAETIETSTYKITNHGESIFCKVCGRESWHPQEVKQKYCGNCNQFHNIMGGGLYCKEVVSPGIWVDQNNSLHVSIPDILDEMELPHTDVNKMHVEALVTNLIKKEMPNVKFVANAACPNCGILGPGPHKDSCPLNK